jgi:hypothetical protein
MNIGPFLLQKRRLLFLKPFLPDMYFQTSGLLRMFLNVATLVVTNRFIPSTKKD